MKIGILNPHLSYLLQQQYGQVEELCRPLSESFISDRHIPNKWTVLEHLAHLGRYQQVFEKRYKLILAGDHPQLDRYVAEEDPKFEDWCKLSFNRVLNKTAEHRKEVNRTLSSLSVQDFRKTGIHPSYGTMTLNDWILFFLLHESHHIYAIFRLIRRFENQKS